MIRFVLLFFLMGAVFLPCAYATPAYVKHHVQNAVLQGEGRLRVYGLDVYDAALYSPKGKAEPQKPLAIAITYLRPLTSKRIIDRSMTEIENLGYSDPAQRETWRTSMTKIIPNVTEGTVITGIRTKAGHTIFYKNAKVIGRIDDAQFTKAFFDIWLSERTSSPALRKKLLYGGQSVQK